MSTEEDERGGSENTGSGDLNALRSTLFETLQAVKSGKMDLDRAKAVNEIGKTLIDSARLEVDYLRVVGTGESQFIENNEKKPVLPNGITGVTRHRLR